MDLLCTENIMNDLETDLLYHPNIQNKQQEAKLLVNNCDTRGSSSAQQINHHHNHHHHSNQTKSSLTSSPGSQYYEKQYSNSSNLSSHSINSSSSGSTYYGSVDSSSSNHGRSHVHETSVSIIRDADHHHHHHHEAERSQRLRQQQQYLNNVYTTNLINRSLDYVNTASVDPIFLNDRCLENALKAEERRPQPACSYFKAIQKDITPPMRKIVTEWMMELCAEEKCQGEVVLLAISYMDRFLLTESVRKTQLQILASACLLLASKLREPSCRALSADLLVYYTENSIYKSDLIQWELYVLSRLGWDLSTVTPLDFLEMLLIRLPIRSKDCPDITVEKVRQHAQAFISLATKDHYFLMYTASTIAASSIAAALSGLNWHLRSDYNLRYLLNRLTDLTSVDQESLQNCMKKMEDLFEEHSRNLEPFLASLERNHNHQTIQQGSHSTHNQNEEQVDLLVEVTTENGCPSVTVDISHNNVRSASSNGSTVLSTDLAQKCKSNAKNNNIEDTKS